VSPHHPDAEPGRGLPWTGTRVGLILLYLCVVAFTTIAAFATSGALAGAGAVAFWVADTAVLSVFLYRRRVQRDTHDLDDQNDRLRQELDDPPGPGPERGTQDDQDDPDDPPTSGPTPRS